MTRKPAGQGGSLRGEPSAASPGLFSARRIQAAIRRISSAPMPRVVSAGVPRRMPEGSIGFRSS